MEKKVAPFKIRKGLRQRDHLSPILFNLVGDVLNKMIKKVVVKNMLMTHFFSLLVIKQLLETLNLFGEIY
jgi:hypothetical protein